jgi:hypothetical protein
VKLWHLYPNPKRPTANKHEDPWEPAYDKAFDFVVRAMDEQSARELVVNAREDYVGNLLPLTGDEDFQRETSVWLDPALTVCEELMTEGKPGVIVSNRTGGR